MKTYEIIGDVEIKSGNPYFTYKMEWSLFGYVIYTHQKEVCFSKNFRESCELIDVATGDITLFGDRYNALLAQCNYLGLNLKSF